MEPKLIDEIKNDLNEAKETLEAFLNNPETLKQISNAAESMAGAISSKGKIIACGNGGSHCDAMHFAEELTGKYRESRPSLPAIAISDPSYITCTGNDYGFDYIFSRFIEGFGVQNDILLAISTSGNSPNIIKATKSAKEKGMKTVALTGKNGGRLAEMAEIEIRVPYFGYADRIQEVHIKVIHILIRLIEKQLGYS